MERFPYCLAVGMLSGALLVLQPAPAALAAPAHSGDPLTEVPALLGSASTAYGTTTYTDVATQPNGKTSGYADCAPAPAPLTEGAAAYKLSAIAGTRVSLAVVERATAQGLCKVELYRSSAGGSSLSSLYDASRDGFRVASSACPSTVPAGTRCAIEWRLPSADTYYVVLWPAGDADPTYAAFDLTAAVRQPTTTALSIGRTFATTGNCSRVKQSTGFAATARVSPSTATGVVRFRLLKRNPTTTRYEHVGTYSKTLAGGVASRVLAPSHGRYKVAALYAGDAARAPSASSLRCVDVVTGSRATQRLSGYYGTSADYFLYRGGRTITVIAAVTPLPARGYVRFVVERQVSSTRYVFVASYARELSNGRAGLKFSMPYRSSGLPFYHVRAEYRGDPWHFRAVSRWTCFWITR